MFKMADMIANKRPHGFTSMNVNGERGIGKTIYALRLVYMLARADGMSREEAWRVAVDSIRFTQDELITDFKKHSFDDRIPAVIWDDAGVYGGSMLYAFNIDNAMILKAVMDTARTATDVLILTCPSTHGLLRFLRDYGDYRVNIGYVHKRKQFRSATVIKPTFGMGYRTKWKRQWVDYYKVMIPDWIYQIYMKKRQSYAMVALKELEAMKRKWKKKDHQPTSELMLEKREKQLIGTTLPDLVKPG